MNNVISLNELAAASNLYIVTPLPNHSLCLTGSKVAQKDSGTKGERVHVLSGSGKHLPSLHHSSTLCLSLTRCLGGQPCIVREHQISDWANYVLCWCSANRWQSGTHSSFSACVTTLTTDICSAQFRNLRNLEIALRILGILKLCANLEIAQCQSCAILRFLTNPPLFHPNLNQEPQVSAMGSFRSLWIIFWPFSCAMVKLLVWQPFSPNRSEQNLMLLMDRRHHSQ